jgi:hypothetical protein
MRPRTVEGRVDLVGQVFMLQPGPKVRVKVFGDHAPVAALHGVVKFFLLVGQRKRECRGHF